MDKEMWIKRYRACIAAANCVNHDAYDALGLDNLRREYPHHPEEAAQFMLAQIATTVPDVTCGGLKEGAD